MRISRIETARTGVGESPLWDPRDQVFYFVDVSGKALHRFDPASGTTRRWKMPGMIGAVALRETGGAIVALEDGIHSFDFESGATTPFARPDTLGPECQLNDGKVDRAGRFLVGTMDRQHTRHNGYLYSLAADGSIRTLDDRICISNSLCWSLDNRTLYFSDSPKNRIYAYDYDLATGAVSNRRDWVETGALGGIPDGATVDADGRVWVAICGGGKIVAFQPDGTQDRIIELPVAAPTSLAFGGPDLDRLYVTTIDPSALGFPAGAEGSGDVFVIDGLEARGVPEPRYRG